MRQNKKQRLIFGLIGLLFCLMIFYSHSSVNTLTQNTIINKDPKIELSKENHRFLNVDHGEKNIPGIPELITQLHKELPRHSRAAQLNSSFLFDIRSERINNLFKILHRKEKNHSEVLNELKVISFEDIIQKKSNQEYNKLQVKGDEVQVTEEFVNELKKQSELYSYTDESRKNVKKAKLIKDKPVIVMAADSAYYGPLQTTVYKVHQYFPDYHLIVYDLGLDQSQLEKTKEKCKCEVRNFNIDNKYSADHPHVNNLKKFSWKPIIIQEVLNDFDTVMYVDTSIRFKSNEVAPIIDTLRNIGFLTQYIFLRLVDYTNPQMFKWFEETADMYTNFWTIEANILFFHNNFLTKLLMKAWITCALEEQCIAPDGYYQHRFDQDAITIISSYFFGMPVDTMKYLPAYSFTKDESYFFDIRRYEGMSYF